MTGFPDQLDGVLYLTEGGQETELMYKFGHELPEFALYPLLDDARALADLTGMYTRYLEVAAEHDLVPVMGGLDYRASPDWASKLGISADGLAEYQLRSIAFLRDVAEPFATQLPRVLIAGAVGPRGDAYGRGTEMTAAEAEEYHAAQLETLRAAEVDLVTAMTFNNIPEAIGVARATAAVDLPLSMSFGLDTSGRLRSGATLQEAVETTDAEAGHARPTFYGINCAHPIELEPALTPGPWLERIRSLRPNASAADKIQLCSLGHLESGDPIQLGREVAALTRRLPHVDVVGGCCGTWDDHLREIARNLSPQGAA